MIDLARLRLLRELARRGTMTAVANAFGLTSSAVSQQFATLEREVGVVLLEHIGRRVHLTPEGVRLVAHAEVILEAAEEAERDLRTVRRKPRGELEIACFSTFAKAHLLPAIVRVRERFPLVRIFIRELESPDAIEAVRDGRCQLALTFTYNLVPRDSAADLVSQQVLEESMLLALPETWRSERGPISLERLARESWIVGSRQADDRLLAERACAAFGFVPRINHTVDDYDLLLRMVSAGLGVGLVPDLGRRFSSAKVVVRKPGGTALSRQVHALTRGALTGSPLVLAMTSELANLT
ncbi:DNA-binding transcriptional regulator, LysR family [Dyella sp. OK004]|uniref:LysR substrate-binding domain-containing protein n=1 Tax=Dyella sp. OK004 TaxID=1855292 RepID=UPI0008ECC419|nr:LysR substrate-binding domain-containing protein [Dyella sp. OK004]SFS19999.1 DNA-binding transcriptional regulator, LysR family [Dyella sp. OK004]